MTTEVQQELEPMFSYLPPEHLEAEDVELLLKAIEKDTLDLAPVDIARMARDRTAQIFKYQDGKHRAIVVTQIKESIKGQRELFLWLMAANEFGFRAASFIMKSLDDVAKAIDADFIRCSVTEPALEHLYEKRWGFKKHSVMMYKEV